MRDIKTATLAERMKASAEAKKALLAKFKPKPAAPDPAFAERATRKAAEIEAVRQARAEAKEAVRRARVEQEEAAQQKIVLSELSELETIRAARKERKAAMKAEARAKREARSAIRRTG